MPKTTIPKPFAHLTPEQRKAILDNWDRFQALVSVHTDRFTTRDLDSGRYSIHMDRIGKAAVKQLMEEQKWKAALESSGNINEVDNA